MALIECGECKRQISDRAPACPGCGAPIAASVPVQHVASIHRPSVVEEAPKRSNSRAWLLALLAGAAFIFYRVSSGPAGSSPSGIAPVFRQPEKVVAERVNLEEGEARMYSFTLRSAAKVEVKVSASPKNVDVMLMTADDLAGYKKAHGELFGGKYTYRKALSRQGVLEMTEADTLPEGEWAIVVQRPNESLFGQDTAARIDVTVY